MRVIFKFTKSLQARYNFNLSGILREKANLVTSTYLPLGYEIINSESKGEWVAFALKKL